MDVNPEPFTQHSYTIKENQVYDNVIDSFIAGDHSQCKGYLAVIPNYYYHQFKMAIKNVYNLESDDARAPFKADSRAHKIHPVCIRTISFIWEVLSLLVL